MFQKNVLPPSSQKFVWITDRNENQYGGLSVLDQYKAGGFINNSLTLILLTWRIWWAPNNASKWQMGLNSVCKGLIAAVTICN